MNDPLHRPTLLVLGMPKMAGYKELSRRERRGEFGTIIDAGYRDPLFSFYENLSRADAIIALPHAGPFHLVSLLAEAEVGHPLLLQERHVSSTVKAPHAHEFNIKPIIFLGTKKEWRPFEKQFQVMQKKDLLRKDISSIVQYVESWNTALKYLRSVIPDKIPTTRLHFYEYSKRASDLIIENKQARRAPSQSTIAFFGSASTKESDVLRRADDSARIAAELGVNILHGGGNGGVMGQLSRSGLAYEAFIYGISVDFSGAPKIHFERTDDKSALLEHDCFVASKDMIHRIETYALTSQAFVALDGGIGSMQEIIAIAELLHANHPAVYYLDKQNTRVAKPLLVQNEGETYEGFRRYLKKRKLLSLLNRMIFVDTTDQLFQHLKKHLKDHPPKLTFSPEQGDPRSLYEDIPHPHAGW